MRSADCTVPRRNGKKQRSGDVQFAKRYYPQLFQERVEPADKKEAGEEDEEEDEEDEEAWQALPMSQDY